MSKIDLFSKICTSSCRRKNACSPVETPLVARMDGKEGAKFRRVVFPRIALFVLGARSCVWHDPREKITLPK